MAAAVAERTEPDRKTERQQTHEVTLAQSVTSRACPGGSSLARSTPPINEHPHARHIGPLRNQAKRGLLRRVVTTPRAPAASI